MWACTISPCTRLAAVCSPMHSVLPARCPARATPQATRRSKCGLWRTEAAACARLRATPPPCFARALPQQGHRSARPCRALRLRLRAPAGLSVGDHVPLPVFAFAHCLLCLTTPSCAHCLCPSPASALLHHTGACAPPAPEPCVCSASSHFCAHPACPQALRLLCCITLLCTPCLRPSPASALLHHTCACAPPARRSCLLARTAL